MPLVAGEGAATPTRHTRERHRRRVRRARGQRVVVRAVARRRLEELDRAARRVNKRHVHADARLAQVGARPTGAVGLVDHDRAAHRPHPAALRARVVQDRERRVAVGGHVGAAAHAQPAELAREVAHLAVGRVGARGGVVRLERGVVVAGGHVRAAAAVGAARRVRGEAVDVPLVAGRCALERGEAARDRHGAADRRLVEAHRARRRAAHRGEAHLDPVGDGRARTPRLSPIILVDHDRAAEHAVRAVERQRRVKRVRAQRLGEQPVLGRVRQVAVLRHALHRVVVAACISA